MQDGIIAINNRVRQRRLARGLTQSELAELSKIGRSTISNVETGRYTPRVDVALQISRALGCTVEDLFWEEAD